MADNPAKDFLTSRARGWLTIQIARPERIHQLNPPSLAHKADATISTLDVLDDAIRDLTS